MFGSSANRSVPFLQNPRAPFRRVSFMGDQVRGFGFQHDGSADSVFGFFQFGVFLDLGPLQALLAPQFPRNPGGFPPFVAPGTFPTDPSQLPPGLGFLALLNDPFFQQLNPATGQPVGEEDQRAVEAFVLAFPSNLAPIVGQQVTLGAQSGSDATDRVALFRQRASLSTPGPECDLVAKRAAGRLEIGYLYDRTRQLFRTSVGGTISYPTLLSRARNIRSEVTFTCVPPGSGVRQALDRDRDGRLDTLEVLHGGDPADPAQ
jgi:hypothetical protein